MKLVTAATALKTWGARFRFTTELYGPDVPVYGGVIYGDLHLKGYGDPSLSTLDYQRHELHFATADFGVGFVFDVQHPNFSQRRLGNRHISSGWGGKTAEIRRTAHTHDFQHRIWKRSGVVLKNKTDIPGQINGVEGRDIFFIQQYIAAF